MRLLTPLNLVFHTANAYLLGRRRVLCFRILLLLGRDCLCGRRGQWHLQMSWWEPLRGSQMYCASSYVASIFFILFSVLSQWWMTGGFRSICRHPLVPAILWLSRGQMILVIICILNRHHVDSPCWWLFGGPQQAVAGGDKDTNWINGSHWLCAN